MNFMYDKNQEGDYLIKGYSYNNGIYYKVYNNCTYDGSYYITDEGDQLVVTDQDIITQEEGDKYTVEIKMDSYITPVLTKMGKLGLSLPEGCSYSNIVDSVWLQFYYGNVYYPDSNLYTLPRSSDTDWLIYCGVYNGVFYGISPDSIFPYLSKILPDSIKNVGYQINSQYWYPHISKNQVENYTSKVGDNYKQSQTDKSSELIIDANE